MKHCWASTVENIRDASEDGVDDDIGKIEYDINGQTVNGVPAVHATAVIYMFMCPVYNWVTSFADHSVIEANTAIQLTIHVQWCC